MWGRATLFKCWWVCSVIIPEGRKWIDFRLLRPTLFIHPSRALESCTFRASCSHVPLMAPDSTYHTTWKTLTWGKKKNTFTSLMVPYARLKCCVSQCLSFHFPHLYLICRIIFGKQTVNPPHPPPAPAFWCLWWRTVLPGRASRSCHKPLIQSQMFWRPCARPWISSCQQNLPVSVMWRLMEDDLHPHPQDFSQLSREVVFIVLVLHLWQLLLPVKRHAADLEQIRPWGEGLLPAQVQVADAVPLVDLEVAFVVPVINAVAHVVAEGG